jgi:DNA gyrase subunit A
MSNPVTGHAPSLDDLAEIERTIADLQDILANVARQRQIIADELTEIVD